MTLLMSTPMIVLLSSTPALLFALYVVLDDRRQSKH